MIIFDQITPSTEQVELAKRYAGLDRQVIRIHHNWGWTLGEKHVSCSGDGYEISGSVATCNINMDIDIG